MRAILLGVFALGLLSGCDTVRENAGECAVAPPLKAEQRPKPPVSEDAQVFQPGHWDWNGSSYTWREGIWIKKTAGVSSLWMDGFWKREKYPQPCYWVPAHWVN